MDPETAPKGGALRWLRTMDRRVQTVEVWVCVAALAIMIFLAFAQVFLRLFQGGAIQPVGWFDNITRHMVLWVGMLGASLATAEGRHIAIEVFPKLLPPGGRRALGFVINLAGLVLTTLLLVLAVIYLEDKITGDEYPMFVIEWIDLSVQRWPFLVVVPVGLALIAWRFTLRAAEELLLDAESYAEREAEYSEDGSMAVSGRLPAVEEAASAAPVVEEAAAPARRPGRDTDEIRAYTEMSDDEDVNEPRLRRSRGLHQAEDEDDEAVLDELGDSSEEIQVRTDGGDEFDDALERAAGSARFDSSDEGSAESPGLEVTDRLPRPELPESVSLESSEDLTDDEGEGGSSGEDGSAGDDGATRGGAE